jgi:surfeit locus 1 family protein
MTAAARLRWREWTFVVFMLLLTALFFGLGVWQWNRLGEKERLIAAVADRMHRDPVELPTSAMWPTLHAPDYDYRQVSVTGTYAASQTVLVFTSLGEAKGQYGGPGYWVMTPLALESGGAIWINRGFVPQQSKAAFAQGGAVDAGQLTLTGVARLSEELGAFTPGTDAANRIDYVRDIDRLARLADPSLAPFAPVYLDLPAGPKGALPQGGETAIDFPNNHLGYAMTWFGFAILTPILLAFWWRRQVHPRVAG